MDNFHGFRVGLYKYLEIHFSVGDNEQVDKFGLSKKQQNTNETWTRESLFRVKLFLWSLTISECWMYNYDFSQPKKMDCACYLAFLWLCINCKCKCTFLNVLCYDLCNFSPEDEVIFPILKRRVLFLYLKTLENFRSNISNSVIVSETKSYNYKLNLSCTRSYLFDFIHCKLTRFSLLARQH